MPKSTDSCNKILALMYNATTWANVAQNASASPFTLTYLGLHTGNLTAATNSQAENEVAYTSYARKSQARTTGGWNVPSGGATQNAALEQFPQCGVTGATATHVSAGVGASGATAVWHYGALNSSLAIANGITPQFAAGALTITET